MLADRYGLTLSTTSNAARDAYVGGVDLLLTVYPGAAASFDRAIAADPGFALAHIGKARALQIASDFAAMRSAWPRPRRSAKEDQTEIAAISRCFVTCYPANQPPLWPHSARMLKFGHAMRWC